MSTEKIDPILNVLYKVTAYDCSGYGDDRSRDFKNGDDAIEYAKSLADNFSPIVTKIITMDPIYFNIYNRKTEK